MDRWQTRGRGIGLQALEAAKRSRRHLLVLVPLAVAVYLAYEYRRELFGADVPVRVGAALVMLILGWQLARDFGRSAEPYLTRRMEPATAGTVGFIIRLVFLTIGVLFSLRIAGLNADTLAVGGAMAAVVLGLAGQQTFGHLIAGLVLISARPFRVGDRVRLQAGGLAGQVEGVVTSLGLLYTTLAQGEDSIMVPNAVVLSAAVVPLREPAGVDLRARLRPDVKPSLVQELLEEHVRTPTRAEPHIALEEVDSDEVVVRIAATPQYESDGPRLADEILAAIEPVTREGGTGERLVARSGQPGEEAPPDGRATSEHTRLADPARSGD